METIIANKLKEDAAVRQVLFLDGFGSWSSTSPVEMFISPIPKQRCYLDNRIEGISCNISSWERIHDRSFPPTIKVGANYINSRLAQLESTLNGYDSPLFLNASGTVSESAGACLFIVRNNTLITPPLSASILESITRNTIIELAGHLNIEVVEREINRTELLIADEAFLCGTTVEIVPIIEIDKQPIGIKKKGKLTRSLQKIFFDTCRGNRDAATHWLTPVYT